MSITPKHLYAFRGLPSSGKSTFANTFASAISAEHGIEIKAHAADDYFYEKGNGSYAFDVAELGAAHAQCFRRVLSDLETKGIAIVANTNVKQTEINKYKKLADSLEALFTSIVVEKRHDNKNSHNVPQEILDRMEREFVIKLQ